MAITWNGLKLLGQFSKKYILKDNLNGLVRNFATVNINAPFINNVLPTYCARSRLLQHLTTPTLQHHINTIATANTESSITDRSIDRTDTSVIDKMNDESIIKNINQAVEESESRLFAVVYLKGKQYKVTQEDVVMVRFSFPPTTGDKIRLEKVLMVGGKDFTMVGRPILSRNLVKVEATVMEKSLSHYRVKFNYQKRNRIRKFKLRRQLHTMMVINSIEINPVTV